MKRILAIVLTLCMIISMFPVSAHAEEMETFGVGESRELTLGQGETASFAFTPEKSGEYVFYMQAGVYCYDPETGSGYSEDFNLSILHEGSEIYDYGHYGVYLVASAYMEAGQTYTLCVRHPWEYDVQITGTVYLAELEEPDSISIENYLKYPEPGDCFTLSCVADTELPFLKANATWEIEDESVLRVDINWGCEAGVTALAEGTTKVTATLENGLSATTTITVKARVYEDISFGESKTLTLEPEQSAYFHFTPEENGNYAFYMPRGDYHDTSGVGYGHNDEFSLNILNGETYIAGYDYYNNYIAAIAYLEAGQTYTLRATHTTGCDDDITGTVYLDELAEPDSISIDASKTVVAPGESIWFTCIPDTELPFLAGAVTWEVADESILALEYSWGAEAGFTALAAGTTTVTATLENGVSAAVTITVKEPEVISCGESRELTLGQSESAYFLFTPDESDNYVFYMPQGGYYYDPETDSGYSEDFDLNILLQGRHVAGCSYYGDYKAAIAYLEAGQTYTLVAQDTWEGAADITATVYLDKLEEPTAISIEATQTVAAVGSSLWFTCVPNTELPFLTSEVTWEIADESILALEYSWGAEAGFTALAAGTTTVTATLDSGLSASVTVDVMDTALSFGQVVQIAGNNAPDFTFTPEEDGYYAVYAEATEDVSVSIYTPDYSVYQSKQIPANSGEGLTVKLTAGVTYTISTYFDNAEGCIWIGEGVYATAMEITKLPEMMTYVEGHIASGLKLKGMEMSITWSDGTVTEHVIENEYYEIDGMMMTTEVDEVNGVVTLHYCEAEASLDVELIPNPVAAISIVNADEIPGLLENAYYMQWSGYQSHVISRKVQLRIQYTDGTTEIIGADDSVAGYPVRGSSSLSGPGGTNTVTYSLLGQSVTYDAYFAENPVASIELVSEPEPFVLGQDSQVSQDEDGLLYFSSDWACRYDGLVFKINYADGTSEEVSSADLVVSESDSIFYQLPEYKDYPVEAMFYMPEYGAEFGYWTGKQVPDENGQIPMILHYMGSYLHFNVTVKEADVIGGTWGENITWKLTFDGTLIVSGQGEVAENSNEPYPWKEYADQIIKVIFEEGVTNVPVSAFEYAYPNLTSAELKSVEVIGSTAFAQCYALTSVILPDTLTEIDNGAFTDTALTTIEIHEGVTRIGLSAFSSSKLTEIVLPEGLVELGDSAFYGCEDLKSVYMPDSVTYAGMGAFANCFALETANISKGLTYVNDMMFTGCPLKEIEIPDGITLLGMGCFQGATITSVTIPASVTMISSSFMDCTELKEITFLGDAPEMGEYSFQNVTATAYYPAGNATWTEEIMQSCGSNITWVPYGEEETYVQWIAATTSLNGTIDLNIYIGLSDNILNDPNAYVRFIHSGVTVDVPMSEAVEAEKRGDICYRFSCEIFAKQVADTVTIQVMDENGAISDALEYSVMKYCVNQINKNADPELVSVCKALLNYAAAAQTYFDYNTGNLANASLSDADKALPEVDASAYKFTVVGSEPGIKPRSATLMLEAEVAIRVYFTLEEGYDISGYTFTIDGKEVAVQQNDKGYYIESDGIPAKELDDMHQFSVGGLTVNYGALSYVNSKAASDDVLEANLAKALYAYYAAAEALLG